MRLRSPETSFFGSHINKLDAKGRIAAPADFRRALDGDPLRGFYCLPSLRGPFLECGGGDFFSYFKEMIRELDPFDPDREALEEPDLDRGATLVVVDARADAEDLVTT